MSVVYKYVIFIQQRYQLIKAYSSTRVNVIGKAIPLAHYKAPNKKIPN